MPRKQHPIEVYGMDTILDDGVKVEDLDVKNLLFRMLIELKKMNIYFELLTETSIKEEDII